MNTVNPSLDELEARRAQLYARLAEVGDFRRGSVSENYRRCGKPNCACSAPDHPGHGPRRLWTRTGPGGKTVGRQLSPDEVPKVSGELDRYREFTRLTEQIVAINEAICETRPVTPLAQPAGGQQNTPPSTVGEKRGSATRSATSSRPKSPDSRS